MDFKSIIAILLVLATTAFLAFIVGRTIGFIILSVIKLWKWLIIKTPLAHPAWAMRHKFRIWKAQNQWRIDRISELTLQFIFEPFIFGYVVYIIFERLSILNNYAKANPGVSLWVLINSDMEQGMNIYIWFAVLFYIWLIWKTWKHDKDRAEQRKIVNAMETNTRVLKSIARALNVSDDEWKDNNDIVGDKK